VTKLFLEYGLVLLFFLVAVEGAGIPLPGEAALITGAVLASQGHFSIVAVIAVAAFSGALASVVVERAAIAAVVPSVQNPQLTVQNPQLTNLLKYITVDSSGNVTIKGTQISIQGTTVQISGQASAQISAPSASLEGSGTTVIKGGIVTIN